MIAHIYLFAGPSNCTMELLLGLAMSLIPALLAMLAARSFFKVDDLRENNTRLTADNGSLTTKVGGLTGDNTELRVRITQMEADLEAKNGQVSKYRNDLMLVESERNMLREQLAECRSAAVTAGTAAAATGIAAGTTRSAAPTVLYNGTKYRTDDLKIVEGIGPKIEELLHADGIKTWLALGESPIERLQKILDDAGPRFTMHNPATWPRQSMLAHQGDWDGLKKLQDELTAGRE
jgi:predicted flap endonuclease-1-like 5' DNA nuclease